MKSFLSSHIIISSQALILALFITCTGWYIHREQIKVHESIVKMIDNQVSRISELARITDSNGADEIISTIVTDCKSRNEFESYLVHLNTASRKELLEAQQLFNVCGGFYAERKALMVSKLDREYKILTDYVALLSKLGDLDQRIQANRKWEEVINLENTRSSLLNEQVDIQEKIISLLIKNEPNTKKDVTDLLHRADEINQSLMVTDKQVDEVRNALVH
jgi:uncharacterized protein YutE (UPF0331/DUF86 family)